MPYTDYEIRRALEAVPHAGGEAYTESMGKLHPADADTTASTREELIDAVNSSAEIIAVDSDIYMGETELDIGTKTLVGDRGWDGSEGPMLHTDAYGMTSGGVKEDKAHSMLYSLASDGGPRVTGLRLRGAKHDEDFTKWELPNHLSRGIALGSTGGEVDNCEIFGFTLNGVHVRGDYEKEQFTEADVHHCHFHKSYQIGYGYGVSVLRGYGNIHHNYFNEHRHSIDCYGFHTSGYTAAENVFGPRHYSHTVDVHCRTENDCNHPGDDPDAVDWGLRAGGAIDVRHNTFCFRTDVHGYEEQAISVRGVPLEYAEIHDNRFRHTKRPPENSGNDRGYAWCQQNVHGVDSPRCDIYYDPVVPEGEYTAEWNAYDNQFDAPRAPHDGSGASVEMLSPDDFDTPIAVEDRSDDYAFPRSRLREAREQLRK